MREILRRYWQNKGAGQFVCLFNFINQSAGAVSVRWFPHDKQFNKTWYRENTRDNVLKKKNQFQLDHACTVSVELKFKNWLIGKSALFYGKMDSSDFSFCLTYSPLHKSVPIRPCTVSVELKFKNWLIGKSALFYGKMDSSNFSFCLT